MDLDSEDEENEYMVPVSDSPLFLPRPPGNFNVLKVGAMFSDP